MATPVGTNMTTSQDVAVTYVGTDDPFKDRIYRSGLTFIPGQTRQVPATLAQRFLRHSDVFVEGAAAKQKTAEKPMTDPAPPVDDTKELLDKQVQEQDDQRLNEDARFALIDSIDSMDKKAVLEWAEVNYKQKMQGNLGVAKLREMAKGFIDQYGMPA
jgi:hypothetical protein